MSERKSGKLSAKDVEDLFCLALLRTLNTRQVASILRVYNDELKPDARRHLSAVREAIAESEASK